MKIPEFSQFQEVVDPIYPFIPHYVLDDGSEFYMEPIFYTQLQGFKERHEDHYQEIIDAVIAKVRRNKKVIFIGDFESNTFEKDGYVILEVTDITDPLKIFVEDKSRGSDYGD